MSDFLRKSPIHLRTCILYEYAEGKPIFEAFQHFCEVLGDETMDYQEFEFWFQRFATGKRDLDFERSLSLNTHSLTDMPMHIFEKIVENLDLMDRFIVRKVSKHLRLFTDSLSPGFKTITLRIYESSSTVCYDQNAISYTNRPRQFFNNYDICYVEIGDERVEVKHATHLKLALNDLKIVLGNPKLELKEFEMEKCNYTHSLRVIHMFESLQQPIHLESLQCVVNNELQELMILKYLRPKTLKNVHFDMEIHAFPLGKEEMIVRFDEMIRLEQCQHVEMLTVVTYLKLDEFPFESFFNLPRFTIRFESLAVKDVLTVFRTLPKFTLLDHFILKSDKKLNIESIRKQLNQRFTNVDGEPNLMKFNDRKSQTTFEIRFGESEIRVWKKEE